MSTFTYRRCRTALLSPLLLLVLAGNVRGQQAPAALRGRVTDSTGLPLSGVSIQVKGGTQRATTDDAGYFTFRSLPANALLSASFIGFETGTALVDKRSTLEITLRQSAHNIQDVTVVSTGYQTISRERAPGSYSVIDPTRLDGKLKPDLKASLEGQATGVVIAKDGSIEIRGVSTMLATKEPLIVVDGYQISGGLETINQDNIETITILKDAVAASIYGAKSSNGVIVITTKRGRTGEMRVNYKGSYGTVLKPDLSYLRRTNSADYIDAEIDLFNQAPNSYLTTYNNYQYLSRVNYLLLAKNQGWLNAKEVDDEINQLKQNDGIGQVEKYLFRNVQTQQHHISLTGGTDKSRINSAVKYIHNDNNTIRNSDSRLIADIRNDWKPLKNLSIGLLSNINYSTTTAPVRSWSEFVSHTSTALIQPYDLIVNPETGKPQDIYAVNPRKADRYAAIPGLKSLAYNPLRDLELETTKSQNLQLRLGGSVNLTIINGLNIEAGGTWTRGNTVTRTIYDKNSFRLRNFYNDATSVSNPAKHYFPEGGMIAEARNINEAYTFRGQINFNRIIATRHRVTAIAGGEISRDTYDYNTSPTRVGYNDLAGTFAVVNTVDYNNGLYNADMLYASGRTNIGNGSIAYRDNRFVSWYANGAYEYDNRFLVSGSIRLDQTNFFGTDPKFRFKPLWSVGGTYKLSNEKFFEVPAISRLYLRGSYGINGNISLDRGPFLIIAPGAYSALTGDISYSISSPPNNSLRWERTQIYNAGLDLGLFQNRLRFTGDYYLKNSADLLASDAIDPTLGYASLVKNVGQVRNTGIELSLEGDVIKRQHLAWNVLFNYSYNFNKVTKLNTVYQYPSTITSGAIRKEGHPLDAIYAYDYAGLDANGIAQFYTRSGDKVVGGSVEVDDLHYAGTLRPKHVFGVTNSLRHNSFDLSFMLIAKLGNVLRRDAFTGSNYVNENVAKRWRQAGDEANTIYPKLTSWNMDMFYLPYAQTFIESANYLKLRDVTLSYEVDRTLLRRIGLSAGKLYLQSRNLITVVANSTGRDPETSEINLSGGTGAFTEQGFTSLPLRPEFYAGLSFSF
ncbi:SusC/RagA family TonB-linked outer membrane protein [Chitinophaga horti]|uniref:SusC/RagA family TonB-linked outer membrane protein n=1 Tax=Chitinophaga horti TaxID=2920382 RepID=A0ABY6IX13_9BACT|nr:SusC/RagA family TonB-linked outer membrane protein [Chitinophaga horti]UYQ91928.1 SusC/RagA family TonB-linked outer membrane protein [Chitinophaga horti]